MPEIKRIARNIAAEIDAQPENSNGNDEDYEDYYDDGEEGLLL